MDNEQKIREWIEEHAIPVHKGQEPLLVRRLRQVGLTSMQLIGVLNVISSTCMACKDNDDGCQCRNDE